MKLTLPMRLGASSITIVAALLLASPASGYVMTVTTTADSGGGSLRDMIGLANSNGGFDEIAFNIPGPGVHVIQPASPLPAITDTVFIDGSTQPGFSGTPLIDLDGTNAGATTNGLSTTAPTEIDYLAVTRFGGDALTADGVQFGVFGSWIGVDPATSMPAVDGGGVVLTNANSSFVGSRNPGGRNVIEDTPGIDIEGDGLAPSAVTVEANYIGLDPTGHTSVPSAGAGILVHGSTGSTIGDSASAARNFIAGRMAGISVYSDPSPTAPNSSARIIGNFIGTDVSGTAHLGGGYGVLIQNSVSTVVGDTYQDTGNLIEATTTGIESINASFSASRNTIADSFGSAIDVQDSGGVVIGGFTPADGNIIRGSHAAGIFIASDQVLTAFNTITGSGGNGISVAAGSSDPILANSIDGNGGLGIDLDVDGVSRNGLHALGTGANNSQPFPELASAVVSGSSALTVAGKLTASPSTIYNLDFFASPACDTSGFGEGATYLGSIDVTTDTSGVASFNARGSGNLGQTITATATDPDGNTSEFSACRATTSPPPQPTTTTPPTVTRPPVPMLVPPAAFTALKVAPRQKGPVIRGTVRIGVSNTRFEADAISPNSLVARAVTVGRLVKPRVAAGRLTFGVRLHKRAAKVLAHRGKLRLRLRVVVTPPGRPAVSRIMSVVLTRARRRH